ncbi:cytochrome c peroxidase [Pseudomonas sp. NFPP18]|nr:cytochrome c peroxidase [Pseudomonas sp. NFPP17]SDA38759.1 cytochrome c peroxidase [Pseudomonas sp. NFPP15]SEK50374.1 cytochrome c peroxidase [Pseudomonas sp. NFPP18]SFA68442.1 cytochrome c peroxidase [Pseudomonas sp. NFPP13]SFT37260.1 cytochrome c peroxidase [Pseudomonas sp. NFPP25]SFX00538.1 cytochrome c peroxidase [Pseudomonas sp. NFPP16]SFX04213.1 cytochrome c peroxidase [Pseudomonas sp. NFPP14]
MLGMVLVIGPQHVLACATSEPSCLRELYSHPPAQWPAPQVDAGVAWQELGPLPERAPSPAYNPYTQQKADLGRRLFFDPRLSRSGQIACASCHEPDLGFADGRRVSFGHDRAAGRRNAPSLVASGLAKSLFWDGRADSLEMQALMPVVDPKEMAFSVAQLVARLRDTTDYPAQFAQVFPGQALGAEQVAAALATYQRGLLRVAQRTPFERFLRGQAKALSDQQLQGLHLFRTKARCMNCHFGPGMQDDRFHNAGLTFYGRLREDLGRYEVTGLAQDVGRMRTPSLRLVSHTGPWFHNGLASSLDQVLLFYNAGMPRPVPKEGQLQDPLFPVTSAQLKVLELDRTELKALKAFLEAL